MYDRQTIKEMLQYAKTGKTTDSELSEKFGVSTASIKRYLRKFNGERLHKKDDTKSAVNIEVIDFYLTHDITQSQLAKSMGLSLNQIAYVMNCSNESSYYISKILSGEYTNKYIRPGKSLRKVHLSEAEIKFGGIPKKEAKGEIESKSNFSTSKTVETKEKGDIPAKLYDYPAYLDKKLLSIVNSEEMIRLWMDEIAEGKSTEEVSKKYNIPEVYLQAAIYIYVEKEIIFNEGFSVAAAIYSNDRSSVDPESRMEISIKEKENA